MQYEIFSTDQTPNILVAGVDEAGRGPLAGPVFAAAVILDPEYQISGINDSKKLSAKQRDNLAEQIKAHALDWHVACATVQEIDDLNILQATMLAMRRACNGLTVQPSKILIDGNRIPTMLQYPAKAVVKGDAKFKQIAAASIIAKTTRDADCAELHLQYPEYGFNQHKGYATKQHLENIYKYGPCKAHRKSFAPIKQMFLQE